MLKLGHDKSDAPRRNNTGSVPIFPIFPIFQKNNGFAIFMLLIMLSVSSAQQDAGYSAQYERIYSLLSDENIFKNFEGIYYFNEIADKSIPPEKVKEKIFLMEDKSKKNREWAQGEISEERYSELINALGNTRDERAVPILINHLASGTSVADSMRKIGKPAIDYLLMELESDAPFQKLTGSIALVQFLKEDDVLYVARGLEREKIKKTFNDFIADNTSSDDTLDSGFNYIPMARKYAVIAFGHLAEAGDMDAVKTLRTISQNDPYYRADRTKDWELIKVYTVREEAQKVIDRLRAKGIPIDEPGLPTTPAAPPGQEKKQ